MTILVTIDTIIQEAGSTDQMFCIFMYFLSFDVATCKCKILSRI